MTSAKGVSPGSSLHRQRSHCMPNSDCARARRGYPLCAGRWRDELEAPSTPTLRPCQELPSSDASTVDAAALRARCNPCSCSRRSAISSIRVNRAWTCVMVPLVAATRLRRSARRWACGEKEGNCEAPRKVCSSAATWSICLESSACESSTARILSSHLSTIGVRTDCKPSEIAVATGRAGVDAAEEEETQLLAHPMAAGRCPGPPEAHSEPFTACSA